MMIYLDNNATTRVDPAAVAGMLPFFGEQFANPSGSYAAARAAGRAVGEARELVGGLLGCEAGAVVFTSGGTESDNAAIGSALRCYPERRHLVTCATEHPAVLVPMEELRDRDGYELTILGVGADGRIDLDEFRRAIRPGETALVSFMWANNETGVVQPVPEAAAIADSLGVLFHTDAVQAAGKVPLRLAATKVHYASFSGHKFHAPKGVGALYLRPDVRFRPLLVGGGQEGGRRSGTENVAGIVALGIAAQAAASQDTGAVARLRDRLEAKLRATLEGVHPNGSVEHRVPNTSSLRFEGADAEGLLILLDQSGVCCSAGSACHSGALRPSAVLTAMGLTPAQARSTLRLSLSRFTTEAEVDRAAAAIAGAVAKLRSQRQPGGPVLAGPNSPLT
ncbi:cysteine desulfurase NifS [soil metagenome]